MLTATYTNGFRPIKRSTEGSKLIDIQGTVDVNGNAIPKRSYKYDEDGNVTSFNEYVTLIFEDNCQYNITINAINFLCNPEYDGEPNEAFVPQGIMVGRTYSASRAEDGRPIIICLDKK